MRYGDGLVVCELVLQTPQSVVLVRRFFSVLVLLSFVLAVE